jgi:predicted Zn-dependent peptidase
VKVGSYYEKYYPKGISHFIEHMLFKGTKTRTAKELNEDMDLIGGIWNAYTSYEETKYYCVVLKEFWEKGAELLLDILWNHSFPADELEKERNVILEEIKMYEDDLQDFVFDQLNKNLHQNQEERQSILGTQESVSSITRDDLIRFIQEYYGPNNLVFVATGNIEHVQLVEFIKNFGFTREKNLVKHISPYQKNKNVQKEISFEKDIQQSHLAFAIPTVGMKSDDLPTLKVIDSIMGNSSSSRLFQLIREDMGICYSIFTYTETFSDNGYFIGYVGTDDEHLDKAKEIIIAEFERLKIEKITEKELQRYVNSLIGSFVLQMEQNSAMNDLLGVSYLHGLSTDIDEMINEIKKVTIDDIIRVANKFFHRENFVFCKVCPMDEEE